MGERIGQNTPGKLTSSPTEDKALRNVSLLKVITLRDNFTVHYPEKWLWVIDKALGLIEDESYRRAMDMWLEGKEAGYIADTLGISKTSYYDVRKEIQYYALALAAQCGLINIVVKKEG